MPINSSLNQLLQQGELKPLIEQALKIHQVNQAIQPLLPEAFRDAVQVATIKTGSLVLDVPNASMLTILRFQAPELLSQLRKVEGLSGLASLKFRVAPPTVTREVVEEVTEMKRISPETAALLRATAEKLEDEGLRNALLSLAKNL